jgi:vacuolar-type H+-ATPase subunit I/STV1
MGQIRAELSRKWEDNMELSILIAKIAAVIYLSASLGIFFNRDFYRMLSDDMSKNAALTFLMGFVTVIFGFLIVHYHNLWGRNWTVLITMIGWLSLMKGILIIILPKFIQRLSGPFLTDKGLKIISYILLSIGLLFGYFGFVRGSI